MKTKIIIITFIFFSSLYSFSLNSNAITSINTGFQGHFMFDSLAAFQTLSLSQGFFMKDRIYFNIDYLLLVGPSASFFDLMIGSGFSVYPFKKIFFINASIQISPMLITLNNLSYSALLKLGFDIPINSQSFITLGGGIYYRGFVSIINYIKFDNYKKELFSFFFTIEYKILGGSKINNL